MTDLARIEIRLSLVGSEMCIRDRGFERVEVRLVAEQELLPAVEQTVQAAKQRMYIRRFPGVQTGCGEEEEDSEKGRQFFHFRQRVCANIAIKRMQKQIIASVLFV